MASRNTEPGRMQNTTGTVAKPRPTGHDGRQGGGDAYRTEETAGGCAMASRNTEPGCMQNTMGTVAKPRPTGHDGRQGGGAAYRTEGTEETDGMEETEGTNGFLPGERGVMNYKQDEANGRKIIIFHPKSVKKSKSG